MYIYLFLIFLTFSEEELDFLKVKKIPLEELNINTKMGDIDRKMIEFYQKYISILINTYISQYNANTIK